MIASVSYPRMFKSRVKQPNKTQKHQFQLAGDALNLGETQRLDLTSEMLSVEIHK